MAPNNLIVDKGKAKQAQELIDSTLQLRALVAENNWSLISERANHCPFHEDKTPSFHIDYENNRYHCFSGQCNRGGKYASLYYEIEKSIKQRSITFYGAIEEILKKNPDVRAGLGFSSIFEAPFQAVRTRDSGGVLQLNIPKYPKPSYVDTLTLRHVVDKLKKENDIDRIIRFLSDCERDMPEALLIEIYYKNNAAAAAPRVSTVDLRGEFSALFTEE